MKKVYITLQNGSRGIFRPIKMGNSFFYMPFFEEISHKILGWLFLYAIFGFLSTVSCFYPKSCSLHNTKSAYKDI